MTTALDQLHQNPNKKKPALVLGGCRAGSTKGTGVNQ